MLLKIEWDLLESRLPSIDWVITGSVLLKERSLGDSGLSVGD